jgi:hypothetical protein
MHVAVRCWLVTLVLMVGLTDRAQATSYYIPPPCTSLWNHDAVFVGTVLRAAPFNRLTQESQSVTFKIRERFRGSLDSTLQVDNQGRELTVGATVLVYAMRDKGSGRLKIFFPSRTTLIADAEQEVAELRRLSRVKGTRRIVVGTVGPSHAGQPLSDFPLTLTCGSRSYRSRSDRNGRFEFLIDIPSSVCQVRPTFPDAYYVEFSRDIAFEGSRTCIDTALSLGDDGRIAGRLQDSDGSPLQDVTVDIWPAPRTPHLSQGAAASVQTGSDGRFEAAHLPIGRYVLGINSRTDIAKRFSFGVPVYFPRVDAPEAATVISVAKAQRVELDQPFVLPIGMPLASIAGDVVLEDGRQADGAVVRVMTGLIERAGNSLQIAELTADSNGHFNGQFPVGATYWLNVFWPPFSESFENWENVFQFTETDDLIVRASGATLRVALHHPLKR